jgi:hypothetical protein
VIKESTDKTAEAISVALYLSEKVEEEEGNDGGWGAGGGQQQQL